MVPGTWTKNTEGPPCYCNYCGDVIERGQEMFETAHSIYCGEACADEQESGDDTMRETWGKDGDYHD